MSRSPLLITISTDSSSEQWSAAFDAYITTKIFDIPCQIIVQICTPTPPEHLIQRVAEVHKRLASVDSEASILWRNTSDTGTNKSSLEWLFSIPELTQSQFDELLRKYGKQINF